jgi:hypothetical protein
MNKQALKQFQAETAGMSFEELKAHLGINSPAMPFKPRLSRLTVNVMAALVRPEVRFMQDVATRTANVMVAHPKTGKPVRPEVSFVQDLATRRIVGFDVAMGSGK